MRNTRRTAKSLQNEETFKEYVNKVVEILKSKGVEMIKDGSGNAFAFESSKDKKNCAYISIIFVYGLDYKQKINLLFSVIVNDYCDENSLEGMIVEKTKNEISKKYPLSNFHIRLNPEKSGRPPSKPVKEIAEQLYLALKCHNKRNRSKTISKIKRVNERISKLLEKEADDITESFFQ